jgi:hypothetical protein
MGKEKLQLANKKIKNVSISNKNILLILRILILPAPHSKPIQYLKNGVFWNVAPCGSCQNQRFGGT